MATTPARMQQRRRTYAQWASENPVLAKGEIGAATDSTTDATQLAIKIGDGVTAWNSLQWYDGRNGFTIGASMMDPNGLTVVRTNRVPRIQMPATGTSTLYVSGIGFPPWIFQRGIRMGFDVVTEGASGNVRFQFILQDNPSGFAIASAATPLNVTQTLAVPSTGVLQTMSVNSGTAVFPTPGAFGSLYTFELTRLGDDAADTAGLISVCEFAYVAAP